MSSKFFNYVQYGKESTRGTAVAATKKWTGQAIPVPSDTKLTFPKEEFGVRADERRASVQQREYGFTLASSDAIFQLLPMVFSAGLKGNVTASEVTPAQGDYLWTFTPSYTASNAPDAFTVQLANDIQAYRVPYAMCSEIRLSGSINQSNEPSPVKLEADFFGQFIEDATATAAIALPTPTGMNAHYSRLYLDTAWAGVGVTEIAAALRSWELTIMTGNKPVHTGGANNYFATHSEGIPTAMLTFTAEHNATTEALLALQQAATFRVARLKVTGPTIGSGTAHSFVFDLGGTFEEVNLIDSDDRGDNLSSFVLHGHYDDTGAKTLACTVTTNSNAV